jgi:hypothetical protein
METAFTPLGNTVAITAASSAPTGVQASASSTAKAAFAGQYRIVNAGDVTVHLGVGASAAAAATAAAEATSGNPAAGIPLVPGAVEIFSFNIDTYFSGKASENTTIYITPGDGL